MAKKPNENPNVPAAPVPAPTVESPADIAQGQEGQLVGGTVEQAQEQVKEAEPAAGEKAPEADVPAAPVAPEAAAEKPVAKAQPPVAPVAPLAPPAPPAPVRHKPKSASGLMQVINVERSAGGRAVIEDFDLRGLSFANQDLKSVTFKNCHLGTRFDNSCLQGVIAIDCETDGMVLDGADIRWSSLA